MQIITKEANKSLKQFFYASYFALNSHFITQ